VVGPFPGHLGGRDATEFLVGQGKKLVGNAGVALLDRFQDFRDFVHVTSAALRLPLPVSPERSVQPGGFFSEKIHLVTSFYHFSRMNEGKGQPECFSKGDLV
jgi:hypothetical protein